MNQKKLFQEGCYYDHKLDGKAIEAWVGKLRNHNDVNVTKLKHFELELVNDDIIFSKFKIFHIMEMQNLNIKSYN